MESDKIGIKLLVIIIAVVACIEAVTRCMLLMEQYPPMIIMGVARITGVVLIVLIVLVWGRGLSSIGLSPPHIMLGVKKGLIWSAILGAVTLLVFVALYVAGVDPLACIHADLPSERKDILLFFVVGAIVAPMAEEVFFRGVLYGFFRRWGVFVAVVISTLLFVIVHPIGSGIPWPQIFGGILFAVAYETAGSLAAPVIIHILGNLAIFTLSLISLAS
ncbi:MAG: CPBP family intramembrane metalloprotease [Deltaproteobacteria bacterium]|nr:CPBP family intramembrane metalloprotease [Deltaproteobacteria bacterium]